MSTHDDDKRDYEVGYGRPPKAFQFPKGKSANPNGRPKGAKSVMACLKRELEAKITVREGDRTVRMSKGEALAKRLVDKALKGDMAAIRMLTAIDADLSREVEAQAAAEDSHRVPDTDDLDILQHFAELARAGEWDFEKGD